MLNDTFPVIFKHCGHAEKKARRETSALPHKTHTTLTTAYSADQDWFPKDTSLFLFGPREGVFCSQTILGSRRRRRGAGKHWHLVVRKQKWIYPVWQIPLKVAFEAEKQCSATCAAAAECPSGAVEQPQCCIQTFLAFITMYFPTPHHKYLV